MTWPASEIAEYMYFYEVSPFGEYRADVRNGISCSLLANINRSKNSTEYKPADFMPFQITSQKQLENKAQKIMEAIKNGKNR